MGATLTVDHHQPRAHGGHEQLANLVYACARCNEHKGPYWHELHPPHVRLLQPGRDPLNDHFREDADGQVTAITPEGQFFVERLRLNRPQLVAYRRGLRERQLLRADLMRAMGRARALEQRVNELGLAIDAAADEMEKGGP